MNAPMNKADEMLITMTRAPRLQSVLLPRSLLPALSVSLLALAACSQPAAQPEVGADVAETGRRIILADQEPQNWLSHGRNYQETRFSPLDEIDTGNVSKLGLAWFYDLDTNRGQEATPLVIDGIIYTTSAWSKVQAFDGETGKLEKYFSPEAGEGG